MKVILSLLSITFLFSTYLYYMESIRKIIREEITSISSSSEASNLDEFSILLQVLKEKDELRLKHLREEEHLLEIKSIIDSDLAIEEILAKFNAIMIWWSNEPSENLNQRLPK